MKASFAMAVHFHQPVGNFDNVISNACRKCYSPFLSVLKKYPSIKMNLHFTGCLLEWIRDNDFDLFKDICELANKGQVEIMSGGFYEPILSSIPRRDRIGQLNMLSEYVKQNFNQDPMGAWIAERVWEPTMPSDLFDAGIKYVILDDTHFIYSGLSEKKLNGYYLTEDNGKTVSVFPSNKQLRYMIPYKMPQDVINYMRSVTEVEHDPVFVYGDDGEKFGEWPGTFKWVYEEGWLEKFFDELMNNSEWLKTVKVSDVLKAKKPIDRVYLPTGSYEEMLRWSLPAESQEHMNNVLQDMRYAGKEEFYKPFIRGGFWRNFLSKYPESNNMNKKMLYISNKLEELKKSKQYGSEAVKDIEKHLFRGQCNCAYWHGVFGGLYLYHLRNAIYFNLIKCQHLMDKLIHDKKDFLNVEDIDIDADGYNEVILENKYIYLCFDPAEGGALKEFDAKENPHNFINSLARRKEPYHDIILGKIRQRESKDDGRSDELSIDAGIDENFSYDWYNRYSFIDHFIAKGTDISSFSKCQFHETGDFVKESYYYETNKTDKDISLFMKKDGFVSGEPLCVEKTIVLSKDSKGFSVNYDLINTGDKNIETVFAIEFNITLPFADAEIYSVGVVPGKHENVNLKQKIELDNVTDINIRENKNTILDINVKENIQKLWVFPVKTVSQSEKAYELNYQSTAVVLLSHLKIGKGRKKKFQVNMITSL